jgi:two-component system vancomycin resistance associated response regulator VraR
MDVCTAFGNSGLDAAEVIKRECPKVKVIIVTSMPEFSWLERARQIGVDSFWYKEAQKDTILNVCDRTMAGESVYPEETPTVPIGEVTNHDFTERELQILRELITGDSNAEIGERLGVSAGTVKRHVENMLKKAGFHTRTELVAEAGRLGIVIRF